MLYDKKVMLYRLAERPPILRGAETWAITQVQENKMEVAETGMSRR